MHLQQATSSKRLARTPAMPWASQNIVSSPLQPWPCFGPSCPALTRGSFTDSQDLFVTVQRQAAGA